MSIVRIEHDKDRPYVQLNKKLLENPNMSWAAKGLLAYLISRPDNWNVSVTHLSSIFSGVGGGEKAIYKLISELEKNGYCQKKQLRVGKGQFAKYEYVITEFQKILPLASSRDAVPRDAVKGATNNERVITKKKDIFKDEQRITKEPPKLEEKVVDRPSSSFIKNDFSEEEKELSKQIDYIGNVVFKDGSRIKPKTAMRWISKHEFKDIKSAVEYYLKITRIKSKTNDKIHNHEAYFETILKNRYWEVKKEKDYVSDNLRQHEERKRKDEEYWGSKK